MADILTSLAVWQDFNISGEIKAELISESETDEIKTAQIYIDGETAQSGKTKIYAKTAYKKGKTRMHAVIIYNDLSVAENDRLLETFAKNGYLAVSVDIGGKADGKELYTLYPEEYSYANYDTADFSPEKLSGGVKSSCWYRWGVCARYAFEYFKSQKSVCQVAIMGIGYSATVAWQMTATVKGISAAVSLLCNGWLAYGGVRKFGDNVDNAFSDEMLKFIAGVEAQSFAPHTACPVLSLISTNSARFDCDRANDTLARVKNEVYKALDYSVGYVEGTDAHSAIDILLFLSKFLRSEKVYLPKEPNIKAETFNGNASVEVSYDPKSATAVELYYSDGVDNPALRSWRTVEKAADENGVVSFEIEASRSSERVYAFSRVKYENGFTIGSDIICKKLRDKPEADVKSKILYSVREQRSESLFVGKSGVSVLSGVDVSGEGKVEVKSGPMGIAGVYAKGGLLTFKINAEKDKPEDDAILMFDIYSKKPTTVFVKLIVGFFGERTEYRAEIKLGGNRAWKNVMIEQNKFKTEEGRILKSYADVSALEIDSEEEFLVNNLLWL